MNPFAVNRFRVNPLEKVFCVISALRGQDTQLESKSSAGGQSFQVCKMCVTTEPVTGDAISTQSTQQKFLARILVGVQYRILLAAGVVVRLGMVIAAGNNPSTPWNGGGDKEEYLRLARNILAGDGFSYAHVPTAFRPPLFPHLLAGLIYLFPQHWTIALYVLQFFAGLATAWLCGRLANRWAGEMAGRFAFLAALFMPTLVYFTTEVLTESIALLLGILFVLYLDKAMRTPGTATLVILGAISGVAALERFNAVLLAPIACAAVFAWLPRATGLANTNTLRVNRSNLFTPQLQRWRRVLLVALSCLIVTAPWLIRTVVVFHGKALYSTHSGYAAAEGVLMPLGRAQPGESRILHGALGWTNLDIESNSPARPEFRDEPARSKEGWNYAFHSWRVIGWGLLPIAGRKLGAFWLSLDQVMETQSFSWRNRFIRRLGVAVYYVILALAVAGWLRLRILRPEVAYALLFYAVVVTALHLPLTMNTRLRSPLFDPLLASLAGCGAQPLISYSRVKSP